MLIAHIKNKCSLCFTCPLLYAFLVGIVLLFLLTACNNKKDASDGASPDVAISGTETSGTKKSANTSRKQKAKDYIPPKNIKETTKFNTLRFDPNTQKYYKGTQTLRIAHLESGNNRLSIQDMRFDPHAIRTPIDNILSDALFLRLLTIDPKTELAMPILAESWNITKLANDYTYFFELKEFTWSNGLALDAEQVRMSLLRAMSPRIKNPYAAELALAIKGGIELYSLPQDTPQAIIERTESKVQITAPNSRALYISTSSLAIDLLKILAHPIAAILPIMSTDVQDQNLFRLEPSLWTGNGAFVPSIVDNNFFVQLSKNTHSIAKSFVKHIEFILVPNMDTALQMAENEEIDWLDIPLDYNLDALDTTISSQTLATEDSNTRKRNISNLIAHDIHRIPFASEVFLDIPEYSILRTAFFSDALLRGFIVNANQLNYLQTFKNANATTMYAIVKNIASELKTELNSIVRLNFEKNFNADSLAPQALDATNPSALAAVSTTDLYSSSIAPNSPYIKADNIYMPYTRIPPSSALSLERSAKVQNNAKNQGTQDSNNEPTEILPEEILLGEQARNAESDVESIAQPNAQQSNQTALSSTYLGDADLNSSDTDIARITENHFSRILQLLSRGTLRTERTLRIAYTDEFLYKSAQKVANYFEKRGIASTLIKISSHVPYPDSEYPDQNLSLQDQSLNQPPTNRQENLLSNSYDIVIRNLVPSTDSNIGVLAKIWWLIAGGKNPPLNILGKLYQLTKELVYSNESPDFYHAINKITTDIAETSRVVPLWYMHKKEFISIEKFPWWTPLSTWHPLYR